MIDVSERMARAVDAAAELLSKLRLDAMFVGGVARAAWLGGSLDGGPVDVVAVMSPEQKNQVAMMASHRGFRVEREEIERSEELDLIPLHFESVRVHVLVASNALYARMVRGAQNVRLGERELKVPAAEDLALLLTLAEDFESVERLKEHPQFAQERFREMMTAVGLGERVR